MGVCTETDASPRLKKTIVAENYGGEAIFCGVGASAHPSCCDIYGNEGGDWVGCLAELDSLQGNFSADPEFCDAGSGDFRLWNYSPCAQWAYPCGTYPPGTCGLIGVFPVGCWDMLQVETGRDSHASLTISSAWAGASKIKYAIPAAMRSGRVRLGIYDTMGRLIRTLVDDEQGAGEYVTVWNGRNQAGDSAARGFYFCRLDLAGETTTQRFLWMY